MKKWSLQLMILIGTISFVLAVDTLMSELTPIKEPDYDYSKKHESLFDCLSMELSPDEYIMLPNGTAHVERYGLLYTEEHYILRDDILTVCLPQKIEEHEEDSVLVANSLSLISYVGVGISMVFLFIHLFVFTLVPDVQNLPGYNLASLCACLFISYVLMMIPGFSSVTSNSSACVAVAVFTHYFFLAAFLWMSIMAFDVFKSIIYATVRLRVNSKGFKMKRYIFNCLIAFGVPLVFSATAFSMDYIDGVSDDFKPQFNINCWFRKKLSLLTFLGGPLFTIITINFLLFGVSAFSIFCNRMRNSEDNHNSTLRKSHVMYFRLTVIMGVTWITGVLAPALNITWLWHVFAALNTLQGLFIFIAFTFTSKVRKYFKKKLCGVRRSSANTHTPTFQSYCYHASSIEKDIDKMMDKKEKSGSVDTVVIHI